MALIKVNEQNFRDEIINKNGTALVDFFADWCGPCKMVAPILSEIAEENPDITVGKINVDESPMLASQFGVVSIPTIIAFRNGQEIGKIIGYRPKNDILEMLK
ncbi:MAG: thioredoxin [Ruminococcus sp.]|nr:thioredoxin [Ruminococcus sp.]